MWILQRKSDGKSICLLSKEYTVGRKNCNIEVADDLSVSRRHLKLIVDYSAVLQDSGQPVLKVMDLGSTFGVHIISNPTASTVPRKAEPNTWTTLDVNMSFHFGVKNEWTVHWKNINVICSAVGSAERKKLNQQLIMLGAKLVLNWQNDITHLVTDKISLTQKVLDSLLAGKPIVEVKFFENWVQRLEDNPWSAVPDVSEFIPEIGQETLGQFDREMFLPKQERQSLFLGKTFVFANSKESKSSMAEAVEKAGGKVTTDVEGFSTEGSVLVESKSLPLPENYVQLSKSVISRGERSIPEKEIGLAILACSVERFCNPVSKSAEHKIGGSQSHGRASLAFIDSCLLDRETLSGNLSVFTGHNRRDEGPPLKRIKVENAAPKELEHIIPTSAQVLKEKRKRIGNTASDKYEEFQLPPQEVNTIASEKNEQFQPPHKRRHLDQQPTSIKTLHATQHFGNETEMKKTSEAERHNHAARLDATVSSSCLDPNEPSTSLQSKLCATPARSKCDNESIRSESSQWIGRDSPGKLNVSKCMVKSKLVRSELSQKPASYFKENHIVSRVRSMKIACFKEGKWTTK